MRLVHELRRLNCWDSSWEIGTAMEALTELEWPELSVFGGSLPPPVKLDPHTASDIISWTTKWALPAPGHCATS